ncbi:MAG: hypothetical protein Q8Q73_07785 [Stagnimonas sp.]|nr:hypothetical protein [Stagnimonas sp.]
MRAPSFQSFLLVLVLVFGQWLNFAHASKHPALSGGAEPSCEYCLHAQGLGAGLAALPKASLPRLAHEPAAVAATGRFSTPAPSCYPIRGPPSFFA